MSQRASMEFEQTMKIYVTALAIAFLACVTRPVSAESISGKITDSAGSPIAGVMVSAFDDDRRQSTSVFSQADGSFSVDELRSAKYRLRTRLMGKLDEWLDDIPAGASDLNIQLEPARGPDLEEQRPAASALGMLKFDNMRDKLNFKMMCSYCHQLGTIGFRTPEKPVDWETMLRRMDGFGGLYRHTQETIIPRLVETYKDDAVDKWPTFVPPPAPVGTAAKARITAWEVGKEFEGSFHDLEVGPDGLIYAVNISKHRLVTLDPKTGEQIAYPFPRGSYGPHSVELANDGHMWFTLCATGQMAKFDLNTKKFTICSSAEAPAKRGSYPHTLRINPKDPEGLIWYTDAGRNSCFSLHPKTLRVKEYKLLKANQAIAAGKGESRGITPYGIDFSPVDGMIWYSKLNGNRIGRIDPNAPDGDIKEWNPPFRGPRRLHVAPDGMVWVPGFASGVFGKFDPKTEKWSVYPLPDAENQIPYALNIDPKGYVWVCGTGNDSLYRFDPRTEYLVEFRLPMRVSYTREIEFDADGNVWTSTSGPARHMENRVGQVIKLEILDEDDDADARLAADRLGGIKLATVQLSDEHYRGEPPRRRGKPRVLADAKLLENIDDRELPKAYQPANGGHQRYVDRRLAKLTPSQRSRIGALWKEKQIIDPDMPNRGKSFVRIMEFVADGEKPLRAPKKSVSLEEKTRIHRLKTTKRSPFDAFVYTNRIPDRARDSESPADFAGRILGRLANQEGRVLLKLPPGMGRNAYAGFKTFLGSEGNKEVNNCVSCHSAPEFTDQKSHVVEPGGTPKPTPSLRNLTRRKVGLRKAIQSKIDMARVRKSGKASDIAEAYSRLGIAEADIEPLIAFLESLDDVDESQFRKLILDAKVEDVSK